MITDLAYFAERLKRKNFNKDELETLLKTHKHLLYQAIEIKPDNEREARKNPSKMPFIFHLLNQDAKNELFDLLLEKDLLNTETHYKVSATTEIVLKSITAYLTDKLDQLKERPAEYDEHFEILANILKKCEYITEEMIFPKIDRIVDYSDDPFSLEQLLDILSEISGFDIKSYNETTNGDFKYITNLIEINAEQTKPNQKNTSLNAISEKEFLSMHLACLACSYIDKKRISPEDPANELRKQITSTLNTLRISQEMKHIERASKDGDTRKRLYAAFSESIVNQINNNHHINLPTGYKTHTIYVAIKEENESYLMSVYNRGSGSNDHPTDNSGNIVFPIKTSKKSLETEEIKEILMAKYHPILHEDRWRENPLNIEQLISHLEKNKERDPEKEERAILELKNQMKDPNITNKKKIQKSLFKSYNKILKLNKAKIVTRIYEAVKNNTAQDKASNCGLPIQTSLTCAASSYSAYLYDELSEDTYKSLTSEMIKHARKITYLRKNPTNQNPTEPSALSEIDKGLIDNENYALIIFDQYIKAIYPDFIATLFDYRDSLRIPAYTKVIKMKRTHKESVTALRTLFRKNFENHEEVAPHNSFLDALELLVSANDATDQSERKNLLEQAINHCKTIRSAISKQRETNNNCRALSKLNSSLLDYLYYFNGDDVSRTPNYQLKSPENHHEVLTLLITLMNAKENGGREYLTTSSFFQGHTRLNEYSHRIYALKNQKDIILLYIICKYTIYMHHKATRLDQATIRLIRSILPELNSSHETYFCRKALSELSNPTPSINNKKRPRDDSEDLNGASKRQRNLRSTSAEHQQNHVTLQGYTFDLSELTHAHDSHIFRLHTYIIFILTVLKNTSENTDRFLHLPQNDESLKEPFNDSHINAVIIPYINNQVNFIVANKTNDTAYAISLDPNSESLEDPLSKIPCLENFNIETLRLKNEFNHRSEFPYSNSIFYIVLNFIYNMIKSQLNCSDYIEANMNNLFYTTNPHPRTPTTYTTPYTESNPDRLYNDIGERLSSLSNDNTPQPASELPQPMASSSA